MWNNRWVQRALKTFRAWSQDDGSVMAAAVSYYAALSFFPLLLVLISGLGLLMKFSNLGQDAEAQVLNAIGGYGSPTLQSNVAEMLGRVERQSAVGGPLGVLGVLLAAVAMFAQFEKIFDKIWNVEPKEKSGLIGTIKNVLIYRFRAFLMLLALGLLVLIIFFATMAIAGMQRFAEGVLPAGDVVWNVVSILVAVTLNSLVFATLYKVLPRMPVRWREALQGGLLAAVSWEIGRIVLAQFVITEKYSAYGVIGSFLAVMLWIYYASTVVFFAAEYVQVICRDCE